VTVQLYHGDCLDILPTLRDKSVDAVITDPPYGIGYASSRKTRRNGEPRINMPNFGDDTYNSDWLPDVYRICKPNAILYLFMRWDVCNQWKKDIEDAGFVVVQRLIWDKTHWGMGDLRYYGSQTEDVLFCRKGAPSMQYQKRRGNIWRHNSLILPEGQYDHPTQKPLAIISAFVSDSTKEDAVVLDPFMGSGTTGVACVNTRRNFIGTEINKEYFDLAKQRIETAQPRLL